MHTLKIKICASGSSGTAASFVTVCDADGNPVTLTGETGKCADVPVTGELCLTLPAGDYLVKAAKGLAWEPAIEKVGLSKDESLVLRLKEWFDFHGAGLFTGDCHNHINYPTEPSDVTSFMEASGIDCIMLCQGWLSPFNSGRVCDGRILAEYLEGMSTADALVFMGAEYPKTRFGHVCWWKFPPISDPCGCYESYHDSVYFKVAGISDKPFGSPSTELPFKSEPPIFKAARWKKDGGISMVPHPTSWWMDNENASLICTNIAVDYCFSLLAGDIYDTLAVMGYDADHVFYQNLWFHLLNEGYRIAGVAETDGNLRSKHRIGSLRTYAYCGKGEFDRDELLKALCEGRSFMTSGPILLAKCDGKHLPGERITPGAGHHSIAVSVRSHPDPEEYLTWIVLYKNGKPAEIIDIEYKKLRVYEHEFSFDVAKEGREWYVVKAYGRHRPISKEFADVMAYCELCEKEQHYEYTKISQAAFTNPFYFEPEGFMPPKPLRPPLTGVVRDGKGTPLENIRIKVLEDGRTVAETVTGAGGNYRFDSVSLLSEIEASGPGCRRTMKSLYLDYPPLREYFEFIYSGRWALENRNLKPGQIPWGVFKFGELRRILGRMEWDLTLH